MGDFIKPALYICATPIGNLEDITLRALDVLKRVDIIAAEDTRNTSVLLEKYSISTRLISYHKFSESARCELFLNYLKEGKSIALVSDAGTPLISDPGGILVENVLNEGYRVVPIVGACAVTALLSSVNRVDEDFKFIGFIQRSEKQVLEIISKNRFENLVFYESPNRLIATLETILKKYPDKKISIGRELTKKFEEIKTDSISNIIAHYKNNILKGEIVVLLHKDKKSDIEIDIDEKIDKLKALGYKNKEIASILSGIFQINKNDVYKKCIS